MKLRYQYRIYPTSEQQIALAKLFGCCRVVGNDALASCHKTYQEVATKPKSSELQKAFITEAKKTENRQWLGEVSTTSPHPPRGFGGGVHPLFLCNNLSLI